MDGMPQLTIYDFMQISDASALFAWNNLFCKKFEENLCILYIGYEESDAEDLP